MASPNPNMILTHLERFLTRNRIRAGQVLVAVSGGPDSICLLQAVQEVSERYQLTLIAGHLDHCLRGAESDADAAFVNQFCHARSLHCISDKVKQDELSAGRSHLESRARRVRYRWLEEVARREGCRWIMTGHTANDQAETVLHHLLRGTGWRGLRGIAPRRSLQGSPLTNTPARGVKGMQPRESGLLLVRPLLEATRVEVEGFLNERGLRARLDRSNEDETLMRNRLRHRVLPLLAREVNPHVVRHLAQLATRARRVYAGIRRRAGTLLRQAALPPAATTLVFDCGVLARGSEDVLQDALRQLWRRQGWALDAMSAARWREVMETCRGERPAVQLPGGVMVRRKLHVLHIVPGG